MAIELNQEELMTLIAMVSFQAAIEQQLDDDQFTDVLERVKEKTGAIPFSSKAEAQFYHRNLLQKLSYMYRTAP